MNIEMKPLIEINQRAIKILYRELGVVDTIRFIRQYSTGFGDYTKERESIFADKSLDDIVAEIESTRNTE
jgi:hypothetical protein